MPDLTVAYAILYVADLPLMARFYGDIVGLPIVSSSERFVAFGGAAAPLALEAGGPEAQGARDKSQNPTLWQFAVPDIEASVAALAEHGVPAEGAIKRAAFGALAFFRDPEGNRFALLQRPD